jgi:adenylosuccinate synthase
MNIIGNGVVIDPVILNEELNNILAFNPAAAQNLLISKRAHFILPVHRAVDACFEHLKGDAKIGSTLKGIAPAYSDKYNRRGIRAGDIFYPDFLSKYKKLTEEHIQIIKHYGFSTTDFKIDGIEFSRYEELWLAAIEQIKHLQFEDTEIYINEAIQAEKKILAEGAQGTLLDIDFGSYPYVTSSNTICSGVCSGLGIAPHKIGRVYGVFKAYCTRVGSGPFPTELFDETGIKLQKKGNEFGSTTGRVRRCGWLDLPALKYAVMLNGVTDLVMTKADVMNSFETILTATSYLDRDIKYNFIPFDLPVKNLVPQYAQIKGWNRQTDDINTVEDLPEELYNYIKFIENHTNIPVSFLSLGPDRKQTYQL